eukprot:14632732-Alexandrium_andersonii.AAC.1
MSHRAPQRLANLRHSRPANVEHLHSACCGPRPGLTPAELGRGQWEASRQQRGPAGTDKRVRSHGRCTNIDACGVGGRGRGGPGQ